MPEIANLRSITVTMVREWGDLNCSSSERRSVTEPSAMIQEQFARGADVKDSRFRPSVSGLVAKRATRGSGGSWAIGIQLRGGEVDVTKHSL